MSSTGLISNRRLISLALVILLFLTITVYHYMYYDLIPSRVHLKAQRRHECSVSFSSGMTHQPKAVIYSLTNADVSTLSDFSKCDYKNCELRPGLQVENMTDGKVIVYENGKIPWNLRDDTQERRNQLWVLYGRESPGFPFNKWRSDLVSHRFNLTATYRADSDITLPISRIKKMKTVHSEEPVNYAASKTKGAYAYVTNCDSIGYDRLKLMNQLKRYVDVEIFGGCTNNHPCTRGDYKCEDDVHKQYRFFLSFENSLCKDYITEKFWYRLNSPGIFIPVALGGLSLDDYYAVAPPNSFLHVYNFTSIEKLGDYMKYLMTNDLAYNSYHIWRQDYTIEEGNWCDVCKMANIIDNCPVYDDLSDYWNNACRSYK